MTIKKDDDRIRQVADLLYQASIPLKILRSIDWDNSVRENFLANNASELPQVSYPKFDAEPCLAILRDARALIKDSSVDAWLTRTADTLETSAKMLAACGSADFYKYSCDLYGGPKDSLPDENTTPLGLANQFDKQISALSHVDLGAPPDACHLAHSVAEEMEKAAKYLFGDAAPIVEVVDQLSANALAGANRIRIRRTACFTDKDVRQLVQHEAYVHVATSLNGQAQPDLKILSAAHPGSTKTQEGLAVFAEFITGSIDLDRMHRLADRVIAIQMAVDGADFIQVYQYFLERTGYPQQSFENARRVFRGGVMSGGAPFTKDVVYLDGLLRVHNFLRTIVATGRANCLQLLFCGKLDIEDIPVLHELTERGLCQPPKYLPPWAQDMRFLLCYLTYSSFLNGVDLSQIRTHYGDLLSSIPAHPVEVMV